MDKRSNKQEVIERRTKDNETSRSLRCESSSENIRLAKEEVEDGLITLEESILRKGMKKGQVLKINVNMQEDAFFEETKLDVAEKPMITFSHVSTVTESEKISFDSIRNLGSRSPSPLLEVPSFKVETKQEVRPPL